MDAVSNIAIKRGGRGGRKVAVFYENAISIPSTFNHKPLGVACCRQD
jgi:hypothetical protein